MLSDIENRTNRDDTEGPEEKPTQETLLEGSQDVQKATTESKLTIKSSSNPMIIEATDENTAEKDKFIPDDAIWMGAKGNKSDAEIWQWNFYDF